MKGVTGFAVDYCLESIKQDRVIRRHLLDLYSIAEEHFKRNFPTEYAENCKYWDAWDDIDDMRRKGRLRV